MLTLFQIGYLLSIVLFIVGLKGLSHPETASRGNRLAAGGMGLAMLLTLFYPIEGAENNYLLIGIALAIGAGIGYTVAQKVLMTKMPEMVSLFNGLGGACAVLIAVVELLNYPAEAPALTAALFTTLFTLFIGGISFTGSLIAWGKLDGRLRDSLVPPKPQLVNSLLLLALIILGAYILLQPELVLSLALLFMLISLIYGITFVTPIGGGDMPVVISLLNSLTGIGAALAGILYNSTVMLIGGILVGASGSILTVLMCNAMNRSLMNVIIGGFGGSAAQGKSDGDQVVKEVNPSDLAIQLKYAGKVMVVPGYGLAVAQAQHTVHELEKLLEAEGVEVKYAIHPVAGRMPGHMNVLLAEADVEYPKLLELENANEQLPQTDVVLVIGANDVVNPAAKTDSGSPIYGMPILDVELAKNVVVLKRSMNAGYAGIQNPLFFGERTRMLFGDAKASISKLKEEVNQA